MNEMIKKKSISAKKRRGLNQSDLFRSRRRCNPNWRSFSRCFGRRWVVRFALGRPSLHRTEFSSGPTGKKKKHTEPCGGQLMAQAFKNSLLGPPKKKKKCLPQLVRPALTAAVHASCINILLFWGAEVGCIDFFLFFWYKYSWNWWKIRLDPSPFSWIYICCVAVSFFFPSLASSCCVGRGARVDCLFRSISAGPLGAPFCRLRLGTRPFESPGQRELDRPLKPTGPAASI